MIKIISTSVSELYLYEQNIIHIKFPKENTPINIADSKGIYKGRTQLDTPIVDQLLFVDLTTNPMDYLVNM